VAFSRKNRKSTINGIIFISIFATGATLISQIEFVRTLGISPLVIGIVLGIFYANTLNNKIPEAWRGGIVFCSKKILRFAIVLYGFRITFGQILDVGMEGFLVSLIMLTTTFIVGTYIGYKIFKMDRDTAILTASGASVCGAAAVLATEPILKAKEHKTAIAVSMVVLFGTISMFLYPLLYTTVIEPSSGFLHMSPQQFGIYVGGTIHEVAQVVAVPASIPNTPQDMANSAVIVKMTRVMLIAPLLIILSLYISYEAKKNGKQNSKVSFIIPWFAVYFILVAGFNSFGIVPQNIVDKINMIDTFLLTMAMTALGMGTVFSKFRGLGLYPIYTALGMFAWLVVGGFIIVKLIVE
jgi:uncharacterized integral membrane protein (TIGR00698 family)